ncbi:MAG: hypothetical protein EHM70_21550, partial [Chloroflexota bacterium]
MMHRIGIPRALHFLQHYPMWRTFFESFGAEVVISPPTNRDILAGGAQMVADVTCLPVKVYAGHVAWLRDHGQVDAVFVPAIRSMERGALHCSKFQALPDLMRATITHCPKLLEIGIDAHRYKIPQEEAFRRLGLQFTRSAAKVRQAYRLACEVDEAYRASMVAEKWTYPEALAHLYPKEWPLPATPPEIEEPPGSTGIINIGLAGHPYCLYDDYINHGLLTRLRQLGVHVQTSEMISEEQARAGIQQTTGQKRWFYENWMSGAAGYFLHDPATTGVITVLAFTCGPDSAMVETITRRAHALERPLMSLVLDEHGSAAGMITRLEAFVDMLRRRGGQEALKNERSRAASRPPEKTPKPAEDGRRTFPAVLREIHRPRLGFPRMGTSAIPLKGLFNGVGAQVELGPALSSRTISLGVRYSPEFICTPYKYILGNMIEMLEAGADTLLYMDGAELCRNSSYTQLLNDVLHDLGYKFKLVSTGCFEKGGVFALPQFLRQFMDHFSWSEVLREIYLALTKMNVLDELERRVQFIRPREVKRDSVAKVWEEANQRVDEAANLDSVKIARRDMLDKMVQVEIDPTRQPVRIVTTGEYYAVLEPFFNLDVERVMGQLGAEVHRSLMLGDWVRLAMVMEALGFHKSEIDQAARPYLRWNIGGEGLVTVGQAVIHARKGFDGLVELLPFTCIPEVTVLNI